MDLKKEMIIVDNKIVTKDVVYCEYNVQNNMYAVKYKNSNKFYNYSRSIVKVVTNVTLVDLDKYYFFLNGNLLKDVVEVYEFVYGDKCFYHVIFNNNVLSDYDDKQLKKVSRKSYDVLDYMKKISEITSINTLGGRKILCEQVEKIELNNLNTSLANYLKLSDDISKENNLDCLIFPFGCNSSQYKAVENAIYNKVSVIEGPPGTGKTQTILNIIANIIVRNMNCQVVSNNNAAIENIEEKLKKYELDFFSALLGKLDNINNFIDNQKDNISSFLEYEEMDINYIVSVLKRNNQIVRDVYKVRQELAILIQKKNDLLLEYKYFKEYINSRKLKLKELKRFNNTKLKVIWNEIMSMDRISLFHKLKYIFFYNTGDFNFYDDDIEVISNTIQNLIYVNEIKELENNILEKEIFVKSNCKCEDVFIKSSMDYFKKYLFLKYRNKRKKYNSQEIRRDCKDFINDYPVILSTTYSSRNTFNKDFTFDYIIMDEASQIDVVTGTLALSSAKYAVVIGDEKQLPNVVTPQVKEKVDRVFMEYNIDKGYSYSLNSFLGSVKNIIENVPVTMLKEHYRCHPKIINFCNKKFYNDELIIMSEDKGEEDVIKVIKTNKGNHSRDKASQRQLDIIKDIIFKLQSDDIGIIAPYNNQVDLIKNDINDINDIDVSTVHKFQGREKEVIIISTVDDDITDFVANANILNVAISRAKKQLIFIVTGNEIKNQNIKDFIDYVEYNNMEILESKIYSVFDLLYKQYELERLEFYKKCNRFSRFDSENFIYYLIKKIIEDYENLDFIFLQPMRFLIRDKSLLTERERQYASHHATHIDFVIFNKLSKQTVLAIEVDGYKNHKEGTKQYERDLLKNSILEKYNIPLVRFKTNCSGEEKEIRSLLDKYYN